MSLQDQTEYYAALMRGETPEPPAAAAPADPPAAPDPPAPPSVRPPGEASPGWGQGLPEGIRGPLGVAIGRALAEQQLQFAATGVLVAPQDVTRYLRPEDYAGPDGRPDVGAISTAVRQLAADEPHLAVARYPRTAASGSGQGAASGGDGGLQSRVDAVRAQMEDPYGDLTQRRTVSEGYRR